MRVEHKSTDDKLLPRSWWNTEEARMQDLTAVKELLEHQEKAWNAMVGFWERSGSPGAPPKSPKARTVRPNEVIQSFP